MQTPTTEPTGQDRDKPFLWDRFGKRFTVPVNPPPEYELPPGNHSAIHLVTRRKFELKEMYKPEDDDETDE